MHGVRGAPIACETILAGSPCRARLASLASALESSITILPLAPSQMNWRLIYEEFARLGLTSGHETTVSAARDLPGESVAVIRSPRHSL